MTKCAYRLCEIEYPGNARFCSFRCAEREGVELGLPKPTRSAITRLRLYSNVLPRKDQKP